MTSVVVEACDSVAVADVGESKHRHHRRHTVVTSMIRVTHVPLAVWVGVERDCPERAATIGLANLSMVEADEVEEAVVSDRWFRSRRQPCYRAMSVRVYHSPSSRHRCCKNLPGVVDTMSKPQRPRRKRCSLLGNNRDPSRGGRWAYRCR